MHNEYLAKESLFLKSFRTAAVFNPLSEIIISGFGILFLVLSLLETSLGLFNSGSQKTFSFFADIVFFNSTHAAFTLVLLFFLPEFKLWRKSNQFLTKSFNLDILFVFFSLAILGTVGGYTKKFDINLALISIPLFLFLNKFIFILLESNHALGQQYGISLLINQSSSNQEMNIKSEKREKFIFKIFRASFFALLLVNIIIYDEGFQLNSWQTLIRFIQMTITIILILNSFFYNKDIVLRKIIFLSRNLTYLLIFNSHIAKYALFANHGIEYVVLTFAVIKNSNANKIEKNKVYKMLVLFSAVWLVATLPAYFLFKKFVTTEIFYVTLFFMNVGAMFHYWLDRVMFRMRNENTRHLIAPLLGNTFQKINLK